MRLGQLARKLERSPTEIIEFLASKNIHIDDGVNNKLEASHLTLVLQQYAPTELQAQIVEDADDLAVELPPDASAKEEATLQETPSQEPIAEVDQLTPEQSDVIRAPKVELAGLKVLGKIELPDPRKKTAETPQENSGDEPPSGEKASSGEELPKEFKKDRRNENFRKPKRIAKNPIALQREQEALAEKQKREEELRIQKERRTQNYLTKVKAHQPTKAARLIKEDAEQLSPGELEERPKTWLGKLLRWFTK